MLKGDTMLMLAFAVDMTPFGLFSCADHVYASTLLSHQSSSAPPLLCPPSYMIISYVSSFHYAVYNRVPQAS